MPSSKPLDAALEKPGLTRKQPQILADKKVEKMRQPHRETWGKLKKLREELGWLEKRSRRRVEKSQEELEKAQEESKRSQEVIKKTQEELEKWEEEVKKAQEESKRSQEVFKKAQEELDKSEERLKKVREGFERIYERFDISAPRVRSLPHLESSPTDQT